MKRPINKELEELIEHAVSANVSSMFNEQNFKKTLATANGEPYLYTKEEVDKIVSDTKSQIDMMTNAKIENATKASFSTSDMRDIETFVRSVIFKKGKHIDEDSAVKLAQFMYIAGKKSKFVDFKYLVKWK